MYNPSEFPADHPVQLWAKTREVLKERTGGGWLLLHGIGFNTANFMKPNQCVMELKFFPRGDEKIGQASIMLPMLTPWAKPFTEYLSKVPGASLPEPLTDPDTERLLLFDDDRKELNPREVDIDAMEGSYNLGSVAGIISPAGPNLYGNLAKWYNDNAEAICNFMHSAYLWNKDHGEYRL